MCIKEACEKLCNCARAEHATASAFWDGFKLFFFVMQDVLVVLMQTEEEKNGFIVWPPVKLNKKSAGKIH